eukprot:TRINITY_DN14744_c0_g1_i1.p1 TRINITY_DN14744_c0_g1~~TRINITY_DN14744_c0_g1_i1.p1  ORF type:complete len:558 (-),score=73.87 TRINITY_DN14744_c0_g1_i1:163-1836(-)
MASHSEILSLSVPQLAVALRSGKFTALEAMKVYKARAAEINHACNAVIAWCDDAEQRAKDADEHLKRTGQVLGPLHGVPCTIKDHVAIKGIALSLNMITLKRREKPPIPGHDDPIVTTLRNLGAIPFAKTLMTQMGGTWGSGGPADGDCLNPWDTLRSPAGSSSGEGALIGAGASPFGVGSDVGGSLRLPSANCGICTLKPTCGRLVADMLTDPGEYSIPATSGIMAKTASEVSAIYADLLSDRWWSAKLAPRVPPIPFDHASFSSKVPLRIGYFIDEVSYPKPCPTARRAVEEAVEGLRRRGHDVVPFGPESAGAVDLADIRGCDLSFFSATIPLNADKPGGRKVRGAGLPSWADEDEPSHPDFSLMRRSAIPNEFVVKGFDHPMQKSNGSSRGYTNLMARRDAIRGRFYHKMNKAGLDVLLCPTVPIPAAHVEEARYVQRANQQCRLFNFLDMPAGHITTTVVSEADLSQPYELGAVDAEMSRAARRSLEDGGLGLPMGVQVATLPWREEICLRAMCEVQEACPFVGGHSKLAPVPRRTPAMGEKPQPISNVARL